MPLTFSVVPWPRLVKVMLEGVWMSEAVALEVWPKPEDAAARDLATGRRARLVEALLSA
jgi:hypothetical protein